VLAGGLLLVLVSCVGPARSFDAYAGKAGATASQMSGPVQTVLLAAQAAARGRAFAPYVSVTIGDAEKDASAIQGAFGSIQPPDPQSDRLRRQLDELLSAAVLIIGDARIAARRDQLDRLPNVVKALGSLAAKLDQFSQAHRP
jgi:hypothetical protein